MALSDFYQTHPHYKTRLLLHPTDSKGDVVQAAAFVYIKSETEILF
ncbi:putative glutamate receptor 2 plant [Corchorus olitorius]|uniref:Glutamate receptor 2 plant n=1 Tax=Corchorus olitorius TaxID=93759 RepID=A0A1R3J737_9ROSI|nr:putative glutamate receptor 2 plant [Corchorus olitorius]